LYSWSLNKSILNLNEKISQRSIDIGILKNDPKIQVYSLIESNKNTLNVLESRSKITQYIKHLDSISKKYDIIFE